jgi:hypothetical protein
MSLTKLSLGTEMSLTFFLQCMHILRMRRSLSVLEAPSLHLHPSLDDLRSGLESDGGRGSHQRQPQMRSRRERSREKMSGAEIRRRMRFLLFGLASSFSSKASLRIRLASSLLVRRSASISLLRLSRS